LYTIPHSELLYSYLIWYTFPPPRAIPLSLTVLRPQFRFPSCLLFYCDRLSACHPNPNPKGQATVFINPGTGWPSYTPRHRVPISVDFYDLHGLKCDYSLLRSPNGTTK
jgi:hypothetical protein